MDHNNNSIDPPLQEIYNTLILKGSPPPPPKSKATLLEVGLEFHELPLVDLGRLDSNDSETEECTKQIYEAACELGLWQVINHGVQQEVLDSMRREQMGVFRQPFKNKSGEKFLNLSANSYRWGNPKATALSQLSWSEALHIPLSDFSRMDDQYNYNLRSTMEAFAKSASRLAQSIAEILGEKLGGINNYYGSFFQEKCTQNSCYLRMNRYPPCPFSSHVHGLIPHTDTSFLTILHGDRVGGLQFYKDGRWVSVKPNPQALIIHIGDLFQAMSNGVYRSIEHRVVAAKGVERHSAAYFFSPTHDAIIESCNKSALYRKFSFSEYRQKIQDDVEATGQKVGLSRFLLPSNTSSQPRTLPECSPGKIEKIPDVNECYSSRLLSKPYCNRTDALAMQ